MSEHDENYWQGPTVGPFIEVGSAATPILHAVHPHCPHCLTAMAWVSTSGPTGSAHCFNCKVTIVANRFLEVPPVNP